MDNSEEDPWIKEPQVAPWVSVLDYFHYPIGKSKNYKNLRKMTTARYGQITTFILIAFLILIPIHRYLIKNGYTLTNKLQILRSVNRRLNKYIYPSDDLHESHRQYYKRLRSRLALRAKTWIFNFSYHASTIFQLAFWLTVLSSLSLTDIHNGDLLFLAARLGRVAAVCLPTILFLTLRPSPLPNTLYLTLIPIHKWLSRMVILQLVLHVSIYCGYFHKNGTWKKALKTENIYGWVAVFGFLVMIITSVLKIRTVCFKLFYISHYFWSWVIVICLQFHVRPVPFTKYTAINVAILLYQIVYRLRCTIKSKTMESIKVNDVSPNLALVEFPNDLIMNPARKPAAHIRLTDCHPNILIRIWKQIIPNYHPYTLVSLPTDNYQRLIIRKSNFEFTNGKKYLIYGSFDPHLLFIGSKTSSFSSPASSKFSISKLSIDAKRVLIVIGGSAISFALPILRVMNYHGIPVKIVWVLKDYRDISILKYFDGFIHGDDFEIFVTGTSEIKEEKLLRNSISYGSILSRKSIISTSTRHYSEYDLERNEGSPLLDKDELENTAQFNSLHFENQIENVEVSMDNEEEETDDEDCAIDEYSHRNSQLFGLEEDINEEVGTNVEPEDIRVQEYSPDELTPRELQIPSPAHSRKSSINEPFIPTYNPNSTEAEVAMKSFRETLKRLNIENKVYRGRPKLNYKYYNWCINEGFTQCSGPVEDSDHNLVCCRDLPKNRVRQEDINAEKIWVLSAGPKPLVDNVKLWANEYGLKFHEEAFYA